jgi:hypothetical protein
MLFRNCLSFHECSRRAQPVEGLPDTVQALSNVHLLLHTALHRLGHGRGRQRNRLIWLHDLHLLYQALESTEHDDMVSLALSERLGCITSAALRHCQDAFGTPVTEDWLTRLESRRSEEPVARLENAAAWRLLLSDLAEQSSMRERWQFACEVLANRMGLR